ncbi:FMN-dependent alpha-hydroxy acid dehydrogenase [Amylocystis lapponica]|nr:FMN-dependent alpha-hydroxy acid dehydrogenase [Amylocystis lapponica]
MSDLARPVPSRWQKWMVNSYRSHNPPIIGTVDVQKLEDAALEKLKGREDAFWYVYGSAGTRATHADNVSAFSKWKIIPRMLRNVTHRSIETTIFGVKYPSPLLLAPIGVQGIVHPDAELGSAGAAGKLNVPFIMSTASSRSIEAVAKANGNGPRWYQLYWPIEDDVSLSVLSRIKASGFTALVLTVDTFSLGWRPHDIDRAYLPFLHGLGVQAGLTDPVFMAKHGLEPYAADDYPEFPYDPAKEDRLIAAGDAKTIERAFLGDEWMAQITSGVYRAWEHLKFLRENWEGPLVIKGVMCPEDAELAIDNGADGIVVSNHGGRQVDGSISSLYALEQITKSPKVKEAQASGKFTVLFDSGIRTGSDIIKALALGAQGVLYGRPYIYSLALNGEAGVEAVIHSILADLHVTMGLSGYANIADICGKADTVLAKAEC